MVAMTIEAATPERFDDVQHTSGAGGNGRGCQCQWWTLTNAQWERTTKEERAELLREETEATRDGHPAPGLIAYVDGEPVGWVRVGPRVMQPRLARTRAFTPVSEHPWDDPQVWAVTCFVVRREHRGEGVASALLQAAVAHAREHGANVVEGYPVDVAESPRARSNDLFRGTLTMFQEAGFRTVGSVKPGSPVVALTA